MRGVNTFVSSALLMLLYTRLGLGFGEALLALFMSMLILSLSSIVGMAFASEQRFQDAVQSFIKLRALLHGNRFF